MNSEFMSAQADRFAAKLAAKRGADAQVDAAWFAAFGRAPSPEEKQKAIAFLSKSTLSRLCLLMFNMSEFLYVD